MLWYFTAGYLREQIFFDDFVSMKIAEQFYYSLVDDYPSAEIEVTEPVWTVVD
jgi:hypothetical protein